MLLQLFKNSDSLGQAAAEQAADCIRRSIAERGRCRIVLATGNSQLAFLNALIQISGIEWKQVEAFHLDEYVGMPATHPASFRKFLLERVIRETGIVHFHGVEGDAADLTGAIAAVGRELTSAPIDLAFIGIGENGHIAFNDPPADFKTDNPYIVVQLDEPCRRQQVGEGWFKGISEVPTHAISMSPNQIMKAREIISVVPDKRKASAIKLCLEGEIRPTAPASILRRHPNVTLYMDEGSSSLLNSDLLGGLRRDSRATVGP